MARLPGGGGATGGRGYGILTGGDDNALAWTLLKRVPGAAAEAAEAAEGEGNENEDATGRTSFRAELGTVVRRAHGAAVTGIALLKSEEEEEEVRCVSVSNDQWVKVWRVREEGMQLLGEAYSGVADAGDVVVLDEKRDDGVNFRRVMVAGVGLEVWRLQ
ncbi:hypothetical protein PWT90_09354 [Aphanocladium album]|nr:hypothetical protein PWT90_09354 [Aphanocladium album]